MLPFPIRDSAAAQRMDTQNVTGLDHSWAGGHAALADGWHDGWIAAKTGTTMATTTGKTFPFTTNWRTRSRSATLPLLRSDVHEPQPELLGLWIHGIRATFAESNRVGPAFGSTRSRGTSCNQRGYNPWHAGYGWTTVPERLQSAGISWKTYQEWDNFGDNNLEYFTAFKKVAAGLLGRPSLLPYEIQTLAGFYLALPSMPAPVQDAAVLALENAADQLSPADRQLYDRALYRSRPGTLAAEFRKDVESGRLPQVSYLVPSEVDSEHPSVRHRQRAQHCSIKYSTPSPPIPICGRRRP